MKKTLLLTLLSTTFILTGCSQISKEPSYNQESRKTMISEKCTSFFDGCNNCGRSEDATEVFCTKMFCETYEEPKCLDTMHPSRDLNNDGLNDCEIDGTCDDSVNYNLPRPTRMHPSRDLNNDGLNDCEIDGTCDDSVDYTKPKQETTTYNSESRKTMIPETCKSFFDGCNNCNKGENEEHTACTMMYCETYQQPKCLD